MADLREPFELCKVLQNGSLLGISRHAEDDHVLLTFRDRGVLVYNVSKTFTASKMNDSNFIVRSLQFSFHMYLKLNFYSLKPWFSVTIQLQHQKLTNNWSVEQRDEVTCAAVQNRIDRSFVMVVNKTVGPYIM